ncbi:MAG: hypothetical protein RLZZ238_1071 [Planctomycetota bacterium]|jgi:hypothetical protein
MTPAIPLLGTLLGTLVPTVVEPKVLLVGIDGMRPEAMVAARTPAIDALVADGCITLVATTAPETVSGPGWSNVLCGVWPDKHRVVDNRFLISDYEAYPSVFTLIKRADPSRRTAMFANWGPIGERILKSDPIDERVSLADTKNDMPQVDACVEALATGGADFTFAYIGRVDETGHEFGFHADSPVYLEAIERADAHLARMLAAIDARPTRAAEDWLVIVVTDHGGTIDLSHGRDIPEHRTIPFIVSGSAAAKGVLRGTVNQVDTVATVLAHLGIAVDPAWDLDSRAVGLAAGAGGVYGVNLVYNGDAERSSPSKDPKGNRGLAGWTDLGAATTLAYGAHEDYPDETTPGSPSRGRSFMVGGNAGESRIMQRIDLAAAEDDIDAARVGYELSAWLGGFARQRDVAWVELAFIDALGGVRARERLPAATLEDREAAFGAEKPTGFLRRAADGAVPAGARVAEITVRFERSEGACDGYADDVSLVLTRRGG